MALLQPNPTYIHRSRREWVVHILCVTTRYYVWIEDILDKCSHPCNTFEFKTCEQYIKTMFQHWFGWNNAYLRRRFYKRRIAIENGRFESNRFSANVKYSCAGLISMWMRQQSIATEPPSVNPSFNQHIRLIKCSRDLGSSMGLFRYFKCKENN